MIAQPCPQPHPQQPPPYPGRPGALGAAVVLAAAWLGVGGPEARAERGTLDAGTEWIGVGDFDGDTHPDVVVVDKATGGFRLGRTEVGGGLTWLEGQSVGFAPVSSMTVGRFAGRGADSVIVTDPVANRMHEVQPVVGGPPVVTQRYPVQLGPTLVLALDTGRTVPFVGDELLVGSIADSGVVSRLGLYADPAGSLTWVAGMDPGAGNPSAAMAVNLPPGTSAMAGVILRDVAVASGTASASFLLADLRRGLVQPVARLDGLPVGTEFSTGLFPGSAGAHLLSWDPADAAGSLGVRAVLPGPAGAWTLGDPDVFRFGEPLRRAGILTSPGTSDLLITFGNGRVATYPFDGRGAPLAGVEVVQGSGAPRTAVALDPEQVLVLSSSPGAPSRSFSVHRRNGAAWEAVQEGEMPAPAPLRGVINLWEYRDEPFVAGLPGFTGQRTVGDWTAAATLGSQSQLGILQERYRDMNLGLGNASRVNVGTANPATRHVLVNQFHPAISAFGMEHPGPAVSGRARPLPTPGNYDRSVELRFQVEPPGAPGLTVFHRFDAQGDWREYIAPVRLYQATRVSYFVQDRTGARSPIRDARYTFRTAPGRLDDDSDGVPDYVEVAHGLDPAAGADTDSDGVSDMDEIVAGTHPGQSASVPARRAAIATATTFDARVRSRVDDPLNRRFTTAEVGVPIDVRTPQGTTVGRGPVASGVGAAEAEARLSGLPRSPAGRLLSVALPTHFRAVPGAPSGNPFFGRELLALRSVPRPAQTGVLFEWTSGDALAAARQWTDAARAVLGTRESPVDWLLSTDSTLTALLFERQVETLLHRRGTVSTSSALTLFPHRPQDVDRVAVPEGSLSDLGASGSSGEPAYALDRMLESIEAGVNAAAAAPLRELALGLYRISGGEFEVSSALPMPVDALRQFLRGGTLPSGYLAAGGGDAGGAGPFGADALRRAAVSAEALLGASSVRPVVDRVLSVPEGVNEAAGCTLLRDDLGTAWSLIDRHHRPWPLFDAFVLPVGTRLRVRGFGDGPGTCGLASILVESVAFESLPGASPSDTDGDLLDDAWEWRHFGSLAGSGEGDPDADGFGNLQEFLEGTDPTDPASRGGQVQALGPPALALEPAPGGSLRLRLDWPPAFAARLKVDVLAAEALDAPFESLGLGPAPGQDGAIAVDLPPSPVSVRFFMVRLSLR